MKAVDAMIDTITCRHPGVQAIYLFGSWGTADEWPDSDVDIAMLLPADVAKQQGLPDLIGTQTALSFLLHKSIDLLNLRRTSTVFQKEVIAADRRIFTADIGAAEEFEMLVLSFYQKLNEERREVLDDFWRTGRAYRV